MYNDLVEHNSFYKAITLRSKISFNFLYFFHIIFITLKMINTSFQQLSSFIPPLKFGQFQRKKPANLPNYRENTGRLLVKEETSYQKFIFQTPKNDSTQEKKSRESQGSLIRKTSNKYEEQRNQQKLSNSHQQLQLHNLQSIKNQQNGQATAKKEKYFQRKNKSSRNSTAVPQHRRSHSWMSNGSMDISQNNEEDCPFISIQTYHTLNQLDANKGRTCSPEKLNIIKDQLNGLKHQNQRLSQEIRVKDQIIRDLNSKIMILEKENQRTKQEKRQLQEKFYFNINKNTNFFEDFRVKLQEIQKLHNDLKYLQIQNHILQKIKGQSIQKNQHIKRLQKQNKMLALKVKFLYGKKQVSPLTKMVKPKQQQQISLSLSDDEKSLASVTTNYSPRNQKQIPKQRPYTKKLII